MNITSQFVQSLTLITILNLAVVFVVVMVIARSRRMTPKVGPPVPPLPGPSASLQRAVQVRYQELVDKAAQRFEADLAETSTKLNQQITSLSTRLIEGELGRFEAALASLREEVAKILTETQSAALSQRSSLADQAAAEAKAAQAQLMARFEASLGDVINAYLLEALGSEVDLGSQQAYILGTLKNHLPDIKKELDHES